MSLKLGICGLNGRMGQLIKSEIEQTPHLLFAGGIDKNDEPQKLFESSDCVIDFSSPAASVSHASLAAQFQKPLLIGTTGLTPQQVLDIKNFAQKAPILISANTSLGVNVLIKLAQRAAEILGTNFDIEIFEAHHSKKVDAPSGTALALGKAIAAGLDVDFEKHKILTREGHTGERKKNDIGFSVARGGDVAGDHTVFFYGEGERLELTHRATNRKIFASGAVKIAQWLAKQNAGFYTMDDFLNF